MTEKYLKNTDEISSYLTLYNVTEAAELLSCGKNEIYRLLSTGELHGYRTPPNSKTATWRIPQKAIVEFIKGASGI